jgi:precorrin-6B methylase 2
MTGYVLALSDTDVARYRAVAQTAAAEEADQWAAAGIVAGATVADVGCRPGATSAVIAELVGPTGRVYAVDRDPEALSLARHAAERAGLTNLVVSEGAADATGLVPESADVVMLRQVLAHNIGREQAIVNHLVHVSSLSGHLHR